jgi:GTP pyrophosphokinase
MPTTESLRLGTTPFDADWFDQAGADLDEAGRDLLAAAAQWVQEPIAGLKASTGEPLAQHSAAVVRILAGLGTDAATRASALITDLPLDGAGKSGREDALRKAFGVEVVALVQGTRALLRLGHLTGQSSDRAAAGSDQKEMQRKMLLAMAADLRIVLMRLASRQQSLRW